MKRVGLLMGCFNPIHNSHLDLAENILKLGLVDEIEVIPAKDNLNYKDSLIAKAEDRLAMIKLALNNKKHIAINDVEINHPRQLYTYETLAKIKGDRDLYLIIGSDNLRNLEEWKNPDEILKNHKIIVSPRDNDDLEAIINNSQWLKQYQNQIIITKRLEIPNTSSTFIRNNIMNEELIKELIPDSIIKYIANKKLYKKEVD